MPNFDELSQYTAEILLLLVCGNKQLPFWNSSSSFDFNPFIVIGIHQPITFHSNQTTHSGIMTSYWFFKMAAIELENYSFENIAIYLHTKFQWDISIPGWDIATSALWKQLLSYWIVLLISILTHLLSLAWHSASDYHNSSKLSNSQ